MADPNKQKLIHLPQRSAKGARVALRSSAKQASNPFHQNSDPNQEVASVIIRNLDGSIASWNSLSEKRYGYPRSDAEGSISHELLRTIFPYPLSKINDELIRRKVWEGELIHTVRDGSRVKVLSRWELLRDEYNGSLHVREINDRFVPVGPESAQLFEPEFPSLLRSLLRKKWWWLAPILLLSIGLLSVYFFTHERSAAPLIVPHSN